ncbi:hypothetical protein AB1N83_012003 [Pleurotus pulmonarius]
MHQSSLVSQRRLDSKQKEQNLGRKLAICGVGQYTAWLLTNQINTQHDKNSLKRYHNFESRVCRADQAAMPLALPLFFAPALYRPKIVSHTLPFRAVPACLHILSYESQCYRVLPPLPSLIPSFPHIILST